MEQERRQQLDVRVEWQQQQRHHSHKCLVRRNSLAKLAVAEVVLGSAGVVVVDPEVDEILGGPVLFESEQVQEYPYMCLGMAINEPSLCSVGWPSSETAT